MARENAARTVVRVNDGGPRPDREARAEAPMITTLPKGYDPREFRALTFHDAVPKFRDGSDTPCAYLERCLETIAEREAVVQAFAALNLTGAREAADESSRRWKDRQPR